MSFLLCHECYSWVQPENERCPECDRHVDSATPDPPLEFLGAQIGSILCRVGEVAIRRKMLPDRGMVYATTNGLYFLPHRLEHVTRLVEEESPGSSLLWSLASFVWSPLIFVAPFLKSRHVKPTQMPVLRPQYLTRDESRLLPELLMQNPGVFFVPKKSIRIVIRKRGYWKIERLQGTPLKLKPVGNRQRFDDRMSEVVTSERWRVFVTH